MDTIGNLIDKLFTVNLKLIHNKKNQDNLKIQKSLLMSEIDENVNKILKSDIVDDDIIRPQYKTY
jgi:hypothetical protein